MKLPISGLWKGYPVACDPRPEYTVPEINSWALGCSLVHSELIQAVRIIGKDSHHIHENGLQKVLKRAAKKAGIVKKVNTHSSIIASSVFRNLPKRLSCVAPR